MSGAGSLVDLDQQITGISNAKNNRKIDPNGVDRNKQEKGQNNATLA